MPYTNSTWQQPQKLNINVLDSLGSPETSGWSGGVHSFVTTGALHNRALSFNNHNVFRTPASEDGKNWNTTNMTFPVNKGHLYVFQFKMWSNEEYPPVMAVIVEQKDASFVNRDRHASRAGTGVPYEWKTCAVAFQIREDEEITQVRLGITRFFDNYVRGSTGNVLVDEMAVYDYGNTKQSGSIWMGTAPQAKTPFNSGNGEITISSTGAWRLNGSPFVIRSMYSDNGGFERTSLQRGFDNGFNTAYQINPLPKYRAYVLLPSGMKWMGDLSRICIRHFDHDNANNINTDYKDWTALEAAVEDVVANHPNCIGWYFDCENFAWESLDAQEEMCNRIRAKETALGAYHRPIVTHCQHIAGAERLQHVVDHYEFKNNPASSDFGTTHPLTSSGTFYDSLQSAIGYITDTHPDLDIPTSTAVMNIPHLGSYLGVWLIDTVIKGGTGYGIWADRPRTNGWGSNWGFVNQPWWSTAADRNQKLELLYPMMEAERTNELQATFSSGANDGAIGVNKTLRKVGDEVWAAFANKGPNTRTFTVTIAEDINGWTPVWAENGSSASLQGLNSFQVTLPARSGYVARFTAGDVEPQVYNLGLTNPSGGTEQEPTRLEEGQSTNTFNITLDNLTGVYQQHVKFFKVVNDVREEFNYQIVSPPETLRDLTPTISYEDGDKIEVDYWIEDIGSNVLETMPTAYFEVNKEEIVDPVDPEEPWEFVDRTIDIDDPTHTMILDWIQDKPLPDNFVVRSIEYDLDEEGFIFWKGGTQMTYIPKINYVGSFEISIVVGLQGNTTYDQTATVTVNMNNPYSETEVVDPTQAPLAVSFIRTNTGWRAVEWNIKKD